MLKKEESLKDIFILTSTDKVIAVRTITKVDLTTLNEHYIHICCENGQRERIEGVQAIEALMLLKPSALEGKRMKWARQAWFIHNTLGHSYLAMISLMALMIRPFYKQGADRMIKHGIHIHDATVPKPRCF